jgi:Helix-turn-helix domain/RodZ C-terminal domain
MFEIGASLREARLRRGLSAGDVERELRIRERYLRALEEEQWEMLPGEAYAKGFLRTYAEFLGLDGDLYLDEWNSRFGHHEDAAAVEPEPAGRRRIGVLKPVAAGAGIAVVVAAVAAWQLGSGGSPPVRVRSTPSTPATTTRARATPPPAAAPAPTPVYAVFSAPRGRCWLLVRSADATGPVLYEQVLAQGSSLRLRVGGGLWVRLGAPWNVDVAVAGHAVTGLPTSPADVLVSKTGIAPAA